MYRLPDVIQVGPFPLNASLLTLILGGALFHWWLVRKAARAGQDAGLVGDISGSAMLYALMGAKGLELLFGFSSYLAAPALLIAFPAGWQAGVGALLGAAACLAWFHTRKPINLAALADLTAVPALASLGVAMLGRPVPHATWIGAGLLLAALALSRLAKWAAFAGHLALAAVVMGALALTVTDLLGPGGPRLLGIPRLQVGAVTLGMAAYLIASRLEQSRSVPTEE